MSYLLQYVKGGNTDEVAKDYKFICRLDQVARDRAAPVRSQKTAFD